jgi:hypothetical protein
MTAGTLLQLDDRPSGVAQIRLEDPKLLAAEAARKAEAAARGAAERAAKAEERARRAAAEAARAAVPPHQMFESRHDELFGRPASSYAALDAEGLPTEDGEGAPLSKSARKKLGKQMAKQAKEHEAQRAGR